MDEADRAWKDIEMLSRYIPRAPEPEAKATGRCLWCGKKVKKGMRWCDRDCCAAWEKEQRKHGRA